MTTAFPSRPSMKIDMRTERKACTFVKKCHKDEYSIGVFDCDDKSVSGSLQLLNQS